MQLAAYLQSSGQVYLCVCRMGCGGEFLLRPRGKQVVRLIRIPHDLQARGICCLSDGGKIDPSRNILQSRVKKRISMNPMPIVTA